MESPTTAMQMMHSYIFSVKPNSLSCFNKCFSDISNRMYPNFLYLNSSKTEVLVLSRGSFSKEVSQAHQPPQQ